ncbi:hypothetical protein I542_5411 [Mycobacteroides abscessus 1948]|uniref:Uncharacterized protein n=1 Tax=Mycobacteroides abscessus 1948 TaxID=1299323 RepID=A0A829QRX2_9MYCO|nr:hypothetical protein I542_5411 [Mycobacteroides abscessus 1948]
MFVPRKAITLETSRFSNPPTDPNPAPAAVAEAAKTAAAQAAVRARAI